MEKRTLIAVILSLLVLIGWSYFFQKRYIPPQHPQRPIPEIKKEKQAKEEKITKQLPTVHVPEIKPSPEGKGQDIVVESDLYHAVFSTKGGIVKYWEIKKFKDKNERPVVLLRKPGTIPALGLIFEGPEKHIAQKLIYSVNTEKIDLTGFKNKKADLIFTYKDSELTIVKKFTFYSDSYKVDFSLYTEGVPPFMIPLGTDFGIFIKEGREHIGPVLLTTGSERIELDMEDDPRYITERVRWIAQEDKYFTAALIPKTEIKGVPFWKEMNSAEIAVEVEPGTREFILYVGPKEYERLKSLNAGLEHIIDFGWFSFIAMPLFWVLKFFYKIVGNYGWAIVILTFLVRIPFIPIMNKSQQSMKKMQKIQPLIAELREKYKNDSQKLQKEMMAIYKKHKVNPVSGCLPLLLQIPIFIALYNVLLKAIELRGAPFILWINDLAAKDPYYILPILMGITMVIQQKITPTTMDPKQAKMMMLMPVIFTFLFLQFPAGLVLYWLVNNLLGIAQQIYINRKAVD